MRVKQVEQAMGARIGDEITLANKWASVTITREEAIMSTAAVFFVSGAAGRPQISETGRTN